MYQIIAWSKFATESLSNIATWSIYVESGAICLQHWLTFYRLEIWTPDLLYMRLSP